MKAFVYAGASHSRRHGPKGYKNHGAYRPWLRDEFSFRCVYCLVREQWGRGQYGFTVDHLIPQAKDPSRALDYDNLVYACSTCNLFKSDVEDVPDPCQVGFGDLVEVGDDGRIEAKNNNLTGRFMIRVLQLDNRKNTEYRRRMLDVIRSLQSSGNEFILDELMGFPVDLPDLASRQPPDGNSRPNGVQQSFLAKRQRGELPRTY